MPETAIHPHLPSAAPEPGVDVAESTGDHVRYDFCLMPYDLAGPTASDQLAGASLLRKTWSLAGVLAEGTALTDRLQRALGAGRTVWGAKWHADRRAWSWELYFYRRPHTPPWLDPAAIAPLLAPLRLAGWVGGELPWSFFSIGFDAQALRDGADCAVRIYLEDRNLSWRVDGAGIELENAYQVFDVRTALPAFVRQIKASVHLPRHPLALARVLPPPLHRAWRIWLASKRRCDCVYAQRIDSGDLLVVLRGYRWPAAVTDWLAERLDRVAHLRWDVSHGFARAADGDPAVSIGTTACYGSL